MSFVPISVVLIDSLIPLRSSHLISQVNMSPNYTLNRMKATMVESFESKVLEDIAYDQVSFKRNYLRDFLPGEIGCAESHNRARCIVSNLDSGAIILEDDARIFDLDLLFEQIKLFESVYKDSVAVLSLTDFLTSGQRITLPAAPTLFLKLVGVPPLAVAYYLTPRAAEMLRASNEPIRYLADWPPSSVDFYVSNLNLVTHGDGTLPSLIDQNSLRSSSQLGIYRKLSNYLDQIFFVSFRRRSLADVYGRVKRSLIFRIDRSRIQRLCED